jgi:hypothetical protein
VKPDSLSAHAYSTTKQYGLFSEGDGLQRLTLEYRSGFVRSPTDDFC